MIQQQTSNWQNNDQYEEISAEEALQRLEQGEKLFNFRIINLSFSGTFSHKIEIVNCQLINLRINQAIFENKLVFGECHIIKSKVNNSQFKDVTVFAASTIQRLTLKDCTFENILQCRDIEVTENFCITNCSLKAKTDFWNAQLIDWLDIRECNFEGVADFRSMHAEEGINFFKSHFQKDCILRGTAIEKKLDFSQSRFEGLLDLSKAKLKDFVYFEDIEQGENQYFAFTNTLAERIQILPEQLENRLLSEEKKDYKSAMYEYGLLKSCFQNLHQYECEDWAFYRFKVNQRRASHLSLLRPWTYLVRIIDIGLLDFGCRYGTDPFRALAVALLIIILFSGFYAIGFHGFLEPALLVGEHMESWSNRLAYGVVTSVSIFTNGLTNDLTDTAQGIVLILLLMEAILGTILWGLFVVAFGRKVIR